MRTKADDFISEIKELYKKYGLAISHEDRQGGFLIVPLDFEHIEWIDAASDETDAPK